MVSSWFLSLMALSCCVCGLELNVAHTSYQEEEGQSLTLDWTFTPKPDPSLRDLSVHCDMWSINSQVSDLLRLYDGVESPPKDEEFSGRVQFDKDLLREGRIRLHVSSLRTQDSGEYTCAVRINSEVGVDRCRLSVSAARDQTHSKPGPDRDQTHSKPGPDRNQTHSTTGPDRNQTHSNPGPEEPDSGSPGWIGFYSGLGLTAVGFVVVLVLIICHRLKTLSIESDETDSGKSLSELRMNTLTSVSTEG